MIVETGFEQNSNQWFDAKAGIPSSSHFNEIVTTKGMLSKSVEGYMHKLAGEYIAGINQDEFMSWDMKRGLEIQPKAERFFEFTHGLKLDHPAMCYLDERKDRLCSPDGLMPEIGLEIKCPNMKTHVGYLMAGVLPYKYFQQIHGSMYISGFKYWWFMSFYPGLPPFEIKVKRDEKFISVLAKELDNFVPKLAAMIRKLKGG